MKNLDQEQIQKLDQLTATALENVQEAWEIAMKGLRLDSKQYRQICKAGRELQAFRLAVRDMAGDQGVEVEPIKVICGFG